MSLRHTTHKKPTYYLTNSPFSTKLSTSNITYKYTIYMSKFMTNKFFETRLLRLHVAVTNCAFTFHLSQYISLFLWLLFPSLLMYHLIFPSSL